MGYTLTPFAVDLARVTAAIGSRDRTLFESLIREFSEQFEEIDALGEDFDEESDDVADFPEDGQGFEQFTASLREAFTPLLKAAQDGRVPQRLNLRAEPAAITEVTEAVPDEIEADPDDADDQRVLTGVPEELNTPEKFLAHATDAITRLFQGEELDPGHPIARVIAEEGERAEETDEIPTTSSGPQASMRDVMRHLIMGEPYDHQVGFKYGYALESLCRHFGEHLPNEHWCSFRSGASHDWFRKIDRTLKSLGIAETTFRVTKHLEGRGSPIPIPEIADFPSIGYLRLEEIKQAAKALEDADLATVKNADLRASLEELQSWFRTCAQGGVDLVCFYY